MTREALFSRRASVTPDTSLKEVLMSFPGVISFGGGLPSEDAFDMARVREVANDILSNESTWQYIETEGYPPLKQSIAHHMASLGVQTTADQILITSGSQQALDLLAMLFMDPGDRALVEAPGYLGGLKALENYESELVGIPLEDDGLDLNALEQSAARCREEGRPAKLLYTVSTFQNPAGCTLSAAKRRNVLEIARKYGFLIIEDGAYHLLRYDGEHINPIKSIDDEDTVIYLGSLSKVLVPGIRVGWIVASQPIIERLGFLKQATDLAGNTFGQVFAKEWLDRHDLQPAIDLYREKRDVAYEALKRYLPESVRFNRPDGGFFFWLELPKDIDAMHLLPKARENGVTYVPGSAFGGQRNTLRFSFSQVAIKDIDEGVKRLAKTLTSASASPDKPLDP